MFVDSDISSLFLLCFYSFVLVPATRLLAGVEVSLQHEAVWQPHADDAMRRLRLGGAAGCQLGPVFARHQHLKF